MIIPTLMAYMRCDHEGGCDAALSVSLILLVSGGFGFKPAAPLPPGKDWQVAVGPAGQFVTLCPAHKQTVVKPAVELASALGAKH